MSKLPFFVLQGVLLSSSALAASLNCNGHISCTDLGYSKNDVSGCTNYLYCPFDNAYKVCLPDCEDSGDCPSGSSRMTLSQCNGMGGIALYDTTATSDSVCCHMCQSGYGKLSLTNSQNATCTDESYRTFDGYNLVKCCKSCPDGTMKKDGCTITNAIFTETDENGCGTCSCPDGYTLSSDGKECTNTNLDQYGCPDGWTYITSESEITGSGKYCLGKSITLTQDHLVTLPSKSFEFTYATKNGFSTVTVAGGVTKLVSYTHVTIDDNGLAWVRELELHHGGTFKAPMDCGNETCEVKLYGAYPYSFANSLSSATGTTNYATVSQCSSTNSCPVGITDCASGSAGMYLLFADTPSASKYSFGSGCASRCYNSSSSVNDLKYNNCGWMNGTNCNTSQKDGCK